VIHEMLRPGPVRGDHEESGTILSAEHAGECPAIELDALQDLASLADAHAALITDIGVPDRAVAVEADAVG
jgi:hypothetical protein